MSVYNKKVLSLFITLIFTFIMTTPTFVSAIDGGSISVQTSHVDLIQEGAAAQSISLFTAKPFNSHGYSVPTLEETLYEAFINIESSVNLARYRVTADEVLEVFAQIINNSPELFYVDNKIQSYYNSYTGEVAITNLFYKNSYNEIAKMRVEFEEEVDYIISTLDENMNDIEIILAIHEYFLIHFTYDYTYSIYNAYDILINKSGVCQAYSLAYKYILNKLGFECWLVTSDTINHAWNVVKLGDHYYHIDTTWNDAYSTLGKANHDNFLKSENAIIELGHIDINEIYPAEDIGYDDYFWLETSNGMTYLDGKWYYISNSGHLTSYDFATDEIETIYKPNIFISFGEVYSNVQEYNGKLLYNSKNTIYSINTDGTGETPIYTLSSSETRSIFGIAIYKDELIFTLKKSASDEDELQYLLLEELFKELPAETTTPEDENPIVIGDLDGDGIITILDVVILVKALQGNYNLSEELSVNADVTGDGSINIYDLIGIKKILLRK